MDKRIVAIRFPKGLLDTDQRVQVADRLKREASIDLVDWKELSPNAKLEIDTRDLDIEDIVVHRAINIATDEGPACTWEE